MTLSRPYAQVLKHRLAAGLLFSLHAANCVFFVLGMQQTSNQPGELPFPIAYLPVFFLGILGSLYYILNLCCFKWDYSRLGKRLVEIPELSQPLLIESHTYGAVGLLRGTIPFFDWSVYPEGLKVKIMFVGEAFVKTEEMISVSWSSLAHHSKTIRGPLTMPRNVASAVEELLDRSDPHRQTKSTERS
jgi:hypothetical protein